MTIAFARRKRAGGRWRDGLVWLAAWLALAAIVLLALGPVGWHAGWWHFRTAFFYLMPAAAYCGLAAMAMAGVAILFGRRSIRGWSIAVAGFAFVIGAAIAYVPWHYNQLRGTVPPIHDITTDTTDPPRFIAVLPLRANARNSTDYGGPSVAAQQRAAYPAIVPFDSKLSPGDAFKRALDVANAMGWDIVAALPAEGRIEATDTTLLFGFKDDIVIRVTPSAEGSRVDIRSESRIGGSDIGKNASRIARFLDKMRGA